MLPPPGFRVIGMHHHSVPAWCRAQALGAVHTCQALPHMPSVSFVSVQLSSPPSFTIQEKVFSLRKLCSLFLVVRTALAQGLVVPSPVVLLVSGSPHPGRSILSLSFPSLLGSSAGLLTALVTLPREWLIN